MNDKKQIATTEKNSVVEELIKDLELANEVIPYANNGLHKFQTDEEKASCLYELGYRKLPKNAVVWTMEKHAELVAQVRQEFETEYKDKIVLPREKYNHLIQIINRGWLPEPSDWEYRIRLAQEETRKETAREILQKIQECIDKNEIKVNRDDYDQFGFIYMVDCGDIAICLDELAKQYGVDLNNETEK